MIRILLAVCLLCGLTYQLDNNLCKYELYSNLKTLECPPNSIREFPSRIDNDTQFLQFTDNQIRSIPSNLSLIVPKLEKIDLSSNALSILRDETFKNLKHLTTVNILGNNISSIGKNIFDGVQSQFFNLNLRGNRISYINKDAFDGLYAQTTIDLSNNRISRFDPDTFSNLRNLFILKLGKNDLKNVPSKLFKNQQQLFFLDLHSNDIETLSEDVFKGLSALDSLSLNDNKLKKLPDKIIDDSKLLRMIHLEDNYLSYPPSNIPASVTISLSRNSLKCDCQLKKMLFNTTLSTQIRDIDQLVCHNRSDINVMDVLSQMDCTPTTTTTKPTTTKAISSLNDTTKTTTKKETIVDNDYDGTSKTIVGLVIFLVLLILIIVGAVFLYLCRRNVAERVNHMREKYHQCRLRKGRLHSSADDIGEINDQGETKTPMFVKTEIDV